MYTVDVSVVGVAPLMQHRFPVPDFGNIGNGSKKRSGAIDYSTEWKEYLYTQNGLVVEPAIHLERSMIKAATDFKITGRRGKTYKDLFAATVFIEPDLIPFVPNIPVPEEIDADADKIIYADVRPVVIQRARVVRIRPTLKAGWQLDFTISVIDDQLPSDVLNEVLTLAGRAVGIADFRPRFGRFMIAKFVVNK